MDPQMFAFESWEQYIERIDMDSHIRFLRMLLFSFIATCRLLSVWIPPWFGWNVNLKRLWKWLPVVAVVVAAVIRVYEIQKRQAFVDKYGVYPE